MFDIGGSELLVIGIVALIVVGPKDLPGMFRTLGRFTAKARGMAREFSRAMEDAADATGMRETANDIKGLTSKKALGLDALDDAADALKRWNPKLKGGYTPGPLPEPKPASAPVAKAKPANPEAAPTTAATGAKPARSRAHEALAGAAPTAAPAAKPAPAAASAPAPAATGPAAAKSAAAKPPPRPRAARAAAAAPKGDA
ncbi:MAG: Sec-independent protein translocase protein TatB [Phaeovulum sp.]|uniref:Sec-independent protein translocase protein TatB n=1 Tax=Phaeovulum sp. TaxID=2934796 RepID=UPI0027373FDE|nr:Sec-independent protein translocase protein TatB [Phaeovulum sp.]MDP3861076.1 Sec-independent protein translocase protein TatB [Phaeovulum sp.]